MIVLDTHVWLWWVNLDRTWLTERHLHRIESEDVVAVSAISCFEIAWLHEAGRIVLPGSCEKWFELALGGSGITLMPLTPEITVCAAGLPDHHRDPHDRLIIATAIKADAQLMSFDEKFELYAEIRERLIR